MSATRTSDGAASADEALSSLSPVKRSLLAARGGRAGEPPLVAAPRGPDGMPLSSAQQRLWLLDRLVPGLTAYNVARALRLTGRLDAAALSTALDLIVTRHEVLRTRFVETDGAPYAYPAPPRPVELVLEDLRVRPEAEREGAAAAALAAEADRPFDLSSDLLLRARLLRLADREWVLVLCTHHIASDEASRRILYGELAAAYNAAVAGCAPSLPVLTVQYADWARWEQERLSGPFLAQQLRWWRDELAGAPAAIELPVDRPHPPVPVLSGARHLEVLGDDLAAAVLRLARRSGCTLFHVVLAAFAVLLSRYGGSDDVVVGAAVSGRTRPETEPLLGYFSNMLPVRVDTSGEPTFVELVRRVRGRAVEALGHAEVPFARVVEEVAPDRRLGRNPVFQVAVAVESGAADTPPLTGLTVTPVEVAPAQSKFELALIAADLGTGGLRLEWEYSRVLFDAETIERMSRHLRTVLAEVTENPDASICSFAIASEDEQVTLRRWGRVGESAPPVEAPTLPDRVAEVAARAPDAVAVSAVDGDLTYAALDAAANRLAHHLRALGVGPGALVAVCLGRAARLPVTLLGIQRAGAAYVPVDPAFPAERIAVMVADAGCAAVVTTADLLPVLPTTPAPTVVLDRDADALAAHPATPLADRPGPDDLAYVIYTSGSTGRPKGVMVEHRALSAFLAAMSREPGLSAADTLLAVTTLSFDIAALELYLPLWVGGRVVVAARLDALDPDRLATLLDRERVTVMQATPATWRMLVEAGWPGRLELTALCGGEVLPAPLAGQLRHRCRAVWNMYGPTETTIWSLVQRVDASDETIPIGHPVDGTEVLVVDRAGRLAPVGVPGELLVGGAGVARGYLGRDELTAERFVRHPAASGRRVYRTGDLVRWRSGARLEFLGRLDQQVKLRGFRIELGEIEAALREAADVADAVVVLREDRVGDPRLTGYVVPAERPPDSTDLRSALGARLPAYMVPSAIVLLPELPRTPNGKLDRAALPPPELATGQQARYVAPRTPVEIELAAGWAQVLGVPRVGRTDDFFELGGHSLLMVQLVARVRAAFGVDLPLRAAFDHPTLAEMADVVSSQLLADADAADLELLVAEMEGLRQQ